MTAISRIGGTAALALALLTTVTCGKPVKPTVAKATLVSSVDANPDPAGRASPIVVRVYQLKEEGAFAAADFFALYDKDSETLGASVLSREEYELKPGEKRELELKIAPEARFIGAIAAFRDIRNSKWRALSPAPEKGLKDLLSKKRLTLSVAKSELTIAVGK